MTTPHPSGLRAGDRVRWRSVRADDVLASTPAGQTPAYPVERDATLIADPSGAWVRLQYDDEPLPDSALVELLTPLPGGAS